MLDFINTLQNNDALRSRYETFVTLRVTNTHNNNFINTNEKCDSNCDINKDEYEGDG